MIDPNRAFVFKDRPPGDEINIMWMERVYTIMGLEPIDKGTWDFYFEKLTKEINDYAYRD